MAVEQREDQYQKKQRKRRKRTKRYLTAAQLRQRYGNVSHMWLERRLKNDPAFPRALKLGRLRFFDEAELERWERNNAVQD